MKTSGFCRSSDDHQATTPGSPLDRRTLLRSTGQASLAAGLTAAGLGGITPAFEAGASARLQDDACANLIVFAKRAARIESEIECQECKCEDQLVYQLHQRFRAELAEAKCDESGRVIPEGSILTGRIDRWLRIPGPCDSWVGYHRGTFQIEANGSIVMEGEITGTDGFDSTTEDACCHPEIQEGVLTGKGSGELKGCELVASYRGRLPIDDPQRPPCDPDQWREWELAINGIVACSCNGEPPEDCIDFSDLNLGDQYVVGDTFSVGAVSVEAREFEWSNGQLTSNGFAEVQNGGMAGGSGNELMVNNINLLFDFGGTVSAVTIAYGEYGGNINLEVNGDFQNTTDFIVLNGMVLAGANVSVTVNASGELGTIELTGPIQTVMVGGQELWIDDLCYEM